MSSNASTPVYTVRLRGISSDLQQLGPEISAQDLGNLGAAQVITLLKEFAAIDPVRLVDADPHVLLTGARGSFSAKPHQGRLLLQSTGEINASYIELAPEVVPSWLDDADAVLPAANATGAMSTITPPATTSRNLAFGLLFVSLLVLAFSAYFTFRPHPVIPDDNFSPITDKVQLSRLQQQVVGLYANIDGDCTLLVSADGKITFAETNDSDVSPDLTTSSYAFADLAGSGSVLRTDDLGAIIIRDANNLIFYGENFVRKTR
ncbi:MAG: hypothetical protein K9M98_06735 [Cephaloticoccus sp.]|nr:hypothetical protein [Cephaloticoccus sp.]MCF7760184.1 hypothetical protein [Cephaloticoccus sp.]